MNFSKLVSADIPLFKDLLKDIFPKITNPGNKTHSEVSNRIDQVIKKNRLAKFDPFKLKVI